MGNLTENRTPSAVRVRTLNTDFKANPATAGNGRLRKVMKALSEGTFDAKDSKKMVNRRAMGGYTVPARPLFDIFFAGGAVRGLGLSFIAGGGASVLS